MPLHPQSKTFLDAIAEANAPAWFEMELSDARRVFDTMPFFGQPPAVADISDYPIAGVPVRLYRPELNKKHDVIVYFHGGGWVLGSVDSHDVVCRRLALAAGAAVVSVDYRRPPEDPFPAAIEDCFTVCDVLAMDHESFGLSGRMMVAGDSAGGNLSVAVSLMARDRGGPSLAGQMLIYPVIDSAMSGESYQTYGDGFGLTRETMAWFWNNYAGDPTSASRSHPRASPAHEKDLSGLPDTHVLTAEFDVLRSEAELFADRL
ncbi:MAG: alpha/beta hydrolase, partial [Pirellulaceae bacterium]|nr:alpha/beta hydrolase [Pirellulaceae bacterium]